MNVRVEIAKSEINNQKREVSDFLRFCVHCSNNSNMLGEYVYTVYIYYSMFQTRILKNQRTDKKSVVT